jgi:2-haloacid dehalogenase
MLDFSRFTALTFDCYGTLIDRETGILQAVRPVLSVHGVRTTDERILEMFARLEAEEERLGGDGLPGYQPYRDVLRNVMGRLGREFECELVERELDRLPESIKRWPAFSDTAPALRALAERFTINLISNVDDDLFEATLPKLGVEVNRFVSAQLCRSYKPARRNFNVMLALLDLPPDRVLHVAQSRYHDIAPAKELGLTAAWVNRRPGRAGATPIGDAVPDLEVPDLATLARLALA